MHIAEGILTLPHAALWSVVALPFVAFSIRQLRCVAQEGTSQEKALLSLSGAVLFATTLFPVPVPFLGVTSHMCATPILALILGFRAIILPTVIVLLVQALFFGHGGLTSLGANTVSLGIMGALTAIGLFRTFQALKLPRFIAVGLACTFADLAVYTTDAGIVGFTLMGQQSFTHWFLALLMAFAPIQIPLALLEGGISVFLLQALSKRSPSLIPEGLRLSTLPKFVFPKKAWGFGFLILALCALPAAWAQEGYRGLDEVAIENISQHAGHPASGALLDWLQGDLQLSVFFLGGILSGILLERFWKRLSPAEHQSHAS